MDRPGDRPETDREPTRYEEVVRALLAEIDGGAYEIGDRLPTEHELCARFGVSRHTVREALRRLQEMGIILRRQGSGSVLAAKRADGRFVNSISSLDELLQYAATTRLEILSVDRILVDGDLAARLGCRADTQWFRVAALRRALETESPFCYVEVYIDGAFPEVVRDLDEVRYAIYATLEQRYGLRIAEVMQDVEAAPASANVASRLHVPRGSPTLVITRRYFTDAGALVEVAVNSFPGAAFRYSMSLRRQ